ELRQQLRAQVSFFFLGLLAKFISLFRCLAGLICFHSERLLLRRCLGLGRLSFLAGFLCFLLQTQSFSFGSFCLLARDLSLLAFVFSFSATACLFFSV